MRVEKQGRAKQPTLQQRIQALERQVAGMARLVDALTLRGDLDRIAARVALLESH